MIILKKLGRSYFGNVDSEQNVLNKTCRLFISLLSNGANLNLYSRESH